MEGHTGDDTEPGWLRHAYPSRYGGADFRLVTGEKQPAACDGCRASGFRGGFSVSAKGSGELPGGTEQILLPVIFARICISAELPAKKGGEKQRLWRRILRRRRNYEYTEAGDRKINSEKIHGG